MIMRIRNRNADKQKRGFTLTEIAIVLGIVGLILGAIWVAAAAVYNNLRISRATTELLTVAQNVRGLYATSATVDPNADMTFATPTGNALTYVTSNVFPSDMISAGKIVSPWGGAVSVASAQNTNASDSFVVAFDGVPKAACIGMVTSNTGTGRDSGLFQVTIGANGTEPITAGATVTNNANLISGAAGLSATFATVGCTAASDAIAFAFRLKG